MHERDLEPEHALTRLGVDQLGACRGEVGERRARRRPPHTRRGASPGRALRGTCRRACRRRAPRAARPGRRRPASTRPRRPGPRRASRCSSRPPKRRSYVRTASSRSTTATPTWWMPRASTRAMLPRNRIVRVRSPSHEQAPSHRPPRRYDARDRRRGRRRRVLESNGEADEDRRQRDRSPTRRAAAIAAKQRPLQRRDHRQRASRSTVDLRDRTAARARPAR